jgi:hypothetical protein
MLDSVIKSFKNLFTLNNCTFVFLTDKSYFDHITIQQQDAAKKRTYATQHTFFTRKIFLTKPDFDDVRQYLDAVSLDRDAIRADPDRSRDWEQIVRYLAFASRCHYFDLISLVDELLQATAPPTLKLTYERLTRVDVKSNADFQRMVELVYRQYRYVERNRSHANNRLLAELYSIFDPQDAHPHTNGRVNGRANGATSTEKEVEISVEEQAKQKKAKEELVKLLRRYGAIDSQNGNGATDLRLRLVASREPRAEDLDLDEQTRTSISNLRQTIGAARAIDEMLGKL